MPAQELKCKNDCLKVDSMYCASCAELYFVFDSMSTKYILELLQNALLSKKHTPGYKTEIRKIISGIKWASE